MNRLRFTLLVLSLPALFVPLHVTASAQEPANVKSANAEIRELQQERVDILQQAVELARAQYIEGLLDYKSVHETQRDLLEAQLDMAETQERRIQLITAQLKIAEESLLLTQARFRAARTTALDVHQAKSAVLLIKIRLLKQRQADATKGSKHEGKAAEGAQ